MNKPDVEKPDMNKPDIDEANKPEMKNEPLEKKVCMAYALCMISNYSICTYIAGLNLFFFESQSG